MVLGSDTDSEKFKSELLPLLRVDPLLVPDKKLVVLPDKKNQ
jgi:hypothetical protein